MNRINVLNIIAILGMLLVSFSISSQIKKPITTNINKEYLFDLSFKEVKNNSSTLDSLTPSTLLAYSKINSCYLPLVDDSTYFCNPRNSGYDLSELVNDSLGISHKYAKRFLVADLMVLDEKMESRGIKEINPTLSGLFNINTEDSIILNSLLVREKLDYSEDQFKEFLLLEHPENAEEILNLYNKVWKFLTPPLEKKYTFYNNQVYAAGQKICLCELKKDTIEQVAQFAVSAKKFGSINSIYIPAGKRRDYYASQYVITSKCWERDRRYQYLDEKHDQKLGGGKKEVTYYKGAVELPNFLLMHPSDEFPEAVKMNGIHQLALRELSMASLGSPNSLGCIRVSNFGSKFIRWWTPKFANLFIAYQDDRYYKKFDTQAVKITPPFIDSTEGNKFRKWLCHALPDKAIQLNIDSVGDYQNGHILYAYNVYGKLYENKIDPSIPVNELDPQKIVSELAFVTQKAAIESIKRKKEISSAKEKTVVIEQVQPKSIKKTNSPPKSPSVITPPTKKKRKGLIIVGSFKSENNALNFKESLITRGYENVEISTNNSLYRVAIFEENNEEKILYRLKSLRRKYPDAWLIYIQ